jgi:hypothetical protein
MSVDMKWTILSRAGAMAEFYEHPDESKQLGSILTSLMIMTC